jgi:hypothetical protein
MSFKIWGIREVDDTQNVILVDLDGTLATGGDASAGIIGEPNQTAFNVLSQLRNSGFQVVIWTCRTSSYWKHSPMELRGIVETITKWVKEHDAPCNGILMWDKPIFSGYFCDKSWNVRDWAQMLRDCLSDQKPGIDGWLNEDEGASGVATPANEVETSS